MEMYKYHLLQADETPVHVTKENRSDGSQHYMWVYRTVRTESGGQIVLYEYQPTRRADHPREFLKNFSGICITDGYQVYHTIESEREDLPIFSTRKNISEYFWRMEMYHLIITQLNRLYVPSA